MNYIDFILIVIIIWGAFNGFKKGLINELASIIGLILAIFFAKNYYLFLNKKLYDLFESESDFISILSVIIIFFLTILIVKIIAKFLTKIIKFVFLGLVNKIIGSLFGILKSFLVLAILIFIFSKLNEVVNIVEKEKLHQSIVYSKIEKTSFYLIGINYTENGKEE